jgi:PhnB protein
MSLDHVPPGYHSVTPYLTVTGVSALLDFLAKAFDAQETERVPGPDGTVAHAESRIGDSIIMMGEVRGALAPMPGVLYVYVPDTDATYRRALDAGALPVQEPADQFYGDRSAGVRDPAGNLWWIATRRETLSPEEIARRAAERATG